MVDFGCLSLQEAAVQRQKQLDSAMSPLGRKVTWVQRVCQTVGGPLFAIIGHKRGCVTKSNVLPENAFLKGSFDVQVNLSTSGTDCKAVLAGDLRIRRLGSRSQEGFRGNIGA